MRYQIAKRNRVREMLTEIENDPHAIFSEKQLREVIDDENYVLLRAEQHQFEDLRKKRKEKEGWTDFAATMPNSAAHYSRLMQSRKHTEQQKGRLAYWEEKRAHAEKFIQIHKRYIGQELENVQRSWDKLTDRERACFGRPPVNPIDVFDFPLLTSQERGLFYPEPTVWRTTVTDKLRFILEVLEREIEEGGK